jgi:hypothetical protein
VAMAAWSCASHDALTVSGRNGDAPAAADAGIAGNPPQDAGPVPGGGPGPDPGIPPGAAACEGLAPSARGMRSLITPPAVHAVGGTADGEGTLALLETSDRWPGSIGIEFVTPEDGTRRGIVWSSPSTMAVDPLGRGVAVSVSLSNTNGRYQIARAGFDGGTLYYTYGYSAYGYPFAALPAAGRRLLVAGNLGEYPQQRPQALWVDLDTNPATTLASAPLESANILAAGADGNGNSLLVFSGRVAGEVDARWFGPGARPVTGLFTLLTGFFPDGGDPGHSTGIEVAPAVGGGVLLSRVDTSASPAGAISHTRQVCLLAVGSTSCTPAPAWMLRRSDTRLHVVRGGRAWAAVTLQGSGLDCADTVEVIAPDGTSCGSVELRMASGTCDRLPLGVGHDGTVVQTVPRGLLTPSGIGWRWWPAMLR